ncbi:hypothetical protein HPB50_004547 [Hyalomma asiaticum]|uniref:Uncharacterized protein n=1 Tax=Hyalomma asiaticum TaxID=266040 RepID=A0ACB7TEL5_HYAAI|nr:hypothetical protein HPB50_004547 [Hyalomma asiaticum]
MSRRSSRKTTTTSVFSCFNIDCPDSANNHLETGRLRLCHFCRSLPVVLAGHEARPPSSGTRKAKRQQEDHDRLRPLSYPATGVVLMYLEKAAPSPWNTTWSARIPGAGQDAVLLRSRVRRFGDECVIASSTK